MIEEQSDIVKEAERKIEGHRKEVRKITDSGKAAWKVKKDAAKAALLKKL